MNRRRFRSVALIASLVLALLAGVGQAYAEVNCNVGGGGEFECHVRSAEGDYYCVLVGWLYGPWGAIPIFDCVDLN